MQVLACVRRKSLTYEDNSFLFARLLMKINTFSFDPHADAALTSSGLLRMLLRLRRDPCCGCCLNAFREPADTGSTSGFAGTSADAASTLRGLCGSCLPTAGTPVDAASSLSRLRWMPLQPSPEPLPMQVRHRWGPQRMRLCQTGSFAPTVVFDWR